MPSEDSVIGDSEKNEHPGADPYYRGRLTKAILMALPAGVILLGNVCYEPFTPVFEGVLGPMAEREKAWAAMRKLKVTGRTFCVFATKESYDHEQRQRLIAWTTEVGAVSDREATVGHDAGHVLTHDRGIRAHLEPRGW
jgi:hypothetical protein